MSDMNKMSFPFNSDLFEFAVKNGMINESELMSRYEEMQKAKILEAHFGKDWEQHIKQGKDGRYCTRLPNGKQIRKSKRSDFVKCIAEYYEDTPELAVRYKKSLSKIFEEWISFKEKYEVLSPATIERYRDDYVRFFINNHHAEKILGKPFKRITENELDEFIRITIKDMHLTPKAWAKLKALIRGIWLYGAKIKETDIYITSFLETLMLSSKMFRHNAKSDEEQVFTDEEAARIIDRIVKTGYSPHGYGILLVFYTGMRIGELSGLMWDDISEDLKSINVNHMETLSKNSKGVKNLYTVVDHPKTEAGIRKVIIPDAFVPFLIELKNRTGSETFVFTEKGRRLHARSFTDKLYRLCDELKIPRRSMHKIRKTVCSKLCDNGVDERLMLKQIGHTDRRTTETFYHRDRRSDNEKRDILNKALKY